MTTLPDDSQPRGNARPVAAGQGKPPEENAPAAKPAGAAPAVNPPAQTDAEDANKKSPEGTESGKSRTKGSGKKASIETEKVLGRGYTASRQGTHNFNRIDAGEIRGAGHVAGNQTVNNHYASASEASARQVPAWEDELIAVHHLPSPNRSVPEDQIGTRLERLLATRLLLVRHAPSRQEEAESAMRAVLLALRARDPARQAYCSDRYGSIRLETLHQAKSWRADRQGVVIYMYRDDAETLNFFATVERVSALCRRLEEMNCHLVLTASALTGSLLRDESELSRRVAVWTIGDDVAPAPSVDLDQKLSEGFDVTLAMLASLFPGLALREFTGLVDRLEAKPPEPKPPEPKPVPAEPASAAIPVAKPPPPPPLPPTRHKRWWTSARDDVLHELHITLMPPSYASEEGLTALEAGMYFDTAERRAEVQAWLYRRAPIRLSKSIEALTEHYLTAAASNRFCVAYRRMLRGLDAMGIHPVTSDWLARHFQASLEPGRTDLNVLVTRMAELLSEWPGGAQAQGLVENFMGTLASFVSEEERRLASLLAEMSWPDELALTAPYAALFWTTLLGQPEAKESIERTATRQALALDLLMLLVTWFPAPAAKAIGTALANSLAAYEGWPQPGEPAAELPPVVSLARIVLRDLQFYLLRNSPVQWVAVADALGSQFAPEESTKPIRIGAAPAAGAGKDGGPKLARWLLWDCALMLTTALEDSPPPSALSTVLLSDEARARATQALAAIWRATLPSTWADPDKQQSTEALHVEPGSVLWVYHLLAVAVLRQAPADPDRQSLLLGELLAPLRQWLTRSQRLDLVDRGSFVLDMEMSRRDELEDRQARNDATRNIQALQLVMRLLRSSRPAAPH